MFISTLFLFSCTKEEKAILNPPSISENVRVMSNYITELFDSAYTNYSMQVFCDCDCNSFAIGQQLTLSILRKYSEFDEVSFDSLNCLEYSYYFGSLCTLSNSQIDSSVNSKLGQLKTLNVIDSNTVDFIKHSLSIIYTRPDSTTYDSLITIAYSLPNSSNTFNRETAVSIISNARLLSFTFNKYDFPGGHIDGWVHKVAAGCAKAMFDIVKGTVNGDFPPVTGGSKYLKTLGWGFAEGVLLSY